MSTTNSIAPGTLREERLPRRDWILLPLVALITISLALALMEGIARRMFSEGSIGEERCHKLTDPISGLELEASCAYLGKAPESPFIEYRFNSGGYRSDVEFGPKLSGTFRIALVGSSFGMGASTPQERTFAATLPEELSKRTGRSIELYNETIPGPPGLPQSIERRFRDVLATNPDLILWEVTRWDVKEDLAPLPSPPESDVRRGADGGDWARVEGALATGKPRQAMSSLRKALLDGLVSTKDAVKESKTAFMLEHFLYESPSIYVNYSVSGPDEFAGYLKSSPSPEWQARLKGFDQDVESMQAQAAASGVPLAVVLLPSRPQAAMLSMRQWPDGYDPNKLNDELRAIVLRNGAIYIDIFPSFRAISNAGKYYLPVDGHPNQGGHAIISRLLADRLTSGIVPQLNPAITSENTLPGMK